MTRYVKHGSCAPTMAQTLAIVILLAALNGCAPTPARRESVSIDEVVANVHDPVMKRVWLDAHAKNALPPLNRIPVADTAVTQRQATRVEMPVTKPQRSVIPKEAVIAVQPFSEREITRYDGRLEVISHEAGLIRGKLQDGSLLEILYKLPGDMKAVQVRASASLSLNYRDEVVSNTLQRRIVLHDAKRPVLIAIAEGNQKPYRTVVPELGLVIAQGSEGENPPVTVTYMKQSTILNQGETKVVAKGKQPLYAFLLNSYAQDKRYALADPGQPYYVNIILYQ